MQFFYSLLILTFISFPVICQSDNEVSNQPHTWELKFGNPEVDCQQKEICYDILIKSQGDSFALGDFKLHFFYDASVANMDETQKPQIPNGYIANEGIQIVRGGNLYQFGDLPYDHNMHLASIDVRKTY